ncbi:MAG: metallophosphoesterase [Cyanobacteria bacterium Co-bin8]|nr:metallophosphoesterase [Cyanobacteria bacterium Co-bin8]
MGLKRRQFLLGGTTLGLLLGAASLPGQARRDSTHPAPSGLFAPPRGDVRLLVFSDINSSYGSTDYRSEVITGIRLASQWQPDLVLCAGDMIAGQSRSLSVGQIQAMWQGFDRQIFSPLQSQGLPFAFTLGNHDASSLQSAGEYVFAADRQQAEAYWGPRRAALGLEMVDAADFPFCYSFLHRNIFYLVWDASSATIPAAQQTWADQALASPTAQTAALRVVLGHLPLYAVSQGRDRAGEILANAPALQTLMERHRVQLYVCGHHHAYYPARAGQLEFLNCGALGSGPRTWLGRTDAAIQTLTLLDLFFEPNQPPRTVYTAYNMGTLAPIDLSRLPRQIVGPNGRLIRSDLSWNDLTEAEKRQLYVPSLR